MNGINNASNDGDLLGNVLKVLYELGYQEKDESEFICECLGENTVEIQLLAEEFNKRIHSIAEAEVKDIATPITMEVVGVNEDYTLNLKKPETSELPTHLRNFTWTSVKNPTIFRYLEPGDEVLVGHYSNGNKSNCWVMFAKVSNEDYKKKTIYKDINKLYDLNDNTLLLKKWLENLIPEVFKDIKIFDAEGNLIDIKPHPKRLEFERDMAENWKEVKRQ